MNRFLAMLHLPDVEATGRGCTPWTDEQLMHAISVAQSDFDEGKELLNDAEDRLVARMAALSDLVEFAEKRGLEIPTHGATA